MSSHGPAATTSFRTEHLLLGLIANDEDPVTETLRVSSGEPVTIRAGVHDFRPNGDSVNHAHIPLTARAKQTLENSLTEAQRHGHQHVDTEHLLWAVTEDPEAASAKVITASALCIDTLRARLEEQWSESAEPDA